MIRTAIVALVFALAIIFGLPWLILWSLLTGNQDLMYNLSMGTVRFALRLVGVRVRVEGMENIPPGACIFVANHVSYIDPLAFIPIIPRRLAIPLKKEVFRIPILSYGMRLAKFVPVDRASRKASTESLRLALRYLSEGYSLAAYPEGTRSADGRMQEFKGGAFVMALQARLPIVPVSIIGAHKLLPKGEIAIRPGEVIVHFGTPVNTSEYSPADRQKLIARVEALVAAGLPPDQQPAPPEQQAEQPPQQKPSQQPDQQPPAPL
jgi:1-acyl-sn-glycerol-3-phosphate acyltransferase